MTTFFKDYFSKTFSLEHRSLILARIFLGWICLYDLIIKFREIQFYSPHEGFFPHQYFSSFYQENPLIFGLFKFNDSPITFNIVFLVGIIASICLIGNRLIKPSLLVLWIIFLSLKFQLHLGGKGYDNLMAVTLLWLMVLPCEGRFFGTKKSYHFSNAASFGWIVQILLLYSFSFFFKIGIPEWGDSFSALNMILHKIVTMTVFTHLLFFSEDLLKVLTVLTMFIEAFVPLLLIFGFVNRNVRLWGILLLIFFHTLIMFFLNVGIFSPLSILIWISLLPDNFWKNIFPETLSFERYEKTSRFLTLATVTLLIIVIISNFNYFFNSKKINDYLKIVSLNQKWIMYSQRNYLSPASIWIISEANYHDDKKATWDEFNQREVSYNIPRTGSEIYPNYMWRNVITEIIVDSYNKKNMNSIRYLGNYLCAKNSTIKNIKLISIKHNFLTNEKVIRPIYEQPCFQ